MKVKKRVLLFIVALAMIFTGCSNVSGDQQPDVYADMQFRLIKEQDGGIDYLVDQYTNIVYFKVGSGGIDNRTSAMSVYYILNDHGEAEIAIYGKNYTIDNAEDSD